MNEDEDDDFIRWFDELLILKCIAPTKKLAELPKKLCASSLKVGEHFHVKDAPKDTLDNVRGKLKESLKSLHTSRFEDVRRKAKKCEFTIYDNCARLLSKDACFYDRIDNETTLRYALVDPIMEMMCELGNFKVC